MKNGMIAGLVLVIVLGSGCSGRHTQTSSSNGGLGSSITVINQTPSDNPIEIFQPPRSGLMGSSYNLTLINESNHFEEFPVYQRDPDLGASVNSQTKDVDLQQAELQQDQTEDRAQALASQFGMNLQAARSLTVIADRMSQLSSQDNGLTDEERSELAGVALQITGISPDEVNSAMATTIKTGDKSAVNELVARAATNLGMSNPTALRKQILPSLGIELGE